MSGYINMNGSEFSKLFRSGERLYGTLITSTSHQWPAVVSSMGLDCVFIDLEHFPMDWNQLGWMCQCYRALNIPTIVRIPKPDPFEACRVFDVGATGVVAAYIETAEQVHQLKSAVKLRPLKGKKLDNILSGNTELDDEMKQYVENFNEGKMLLINIESVPAVDSLDSILSVPELDGVLIGPHDLSCSLGVPEQYDHPLFAEAIEKIVAKAHENNIGIGIHNLSTVDQEIKYGKAGINLILRLADLTLFRNALHEDLLKIRKGLGDNFAGIQKKDIII